MKSNARRLLLLVVVIAGVILFHACSKENSGTTDVPAGKQNLTLYLTDAPAFFDKVNIDIRAVQVMVDTCKKNRNHFEENHFNRGDSCMLWTNLQMTPGIYDLLSLRNGIDTLLAGGNIPDGKIVGIKISLGANNSLVKDNVTYPLHLPLNGDSAIVIGLRGNECEEHMPQKFRLWLDFDVARSIIRNRDGQFFLAPFIKCFVVNKKGNISGKVIPLDAVPVITALSGSDTAYALPGRGGEFKMRGLSDGTYSIYINAGNGFKDTTIANVVVKQGTETKLGTITLHR
jgi:Domain of unknown function (DUF4382)